MSCRPSSSGAPARPRPDARPSCAIPPLRNGHPTPLLSRLRRDTHTAGERLPLRPSSRSPSAGATTREPHPVLGRRDSARRSPLARRPQRRCPPLTRRLRESRESAPALPPPPRPVSAARRKRAEKRTGTRGGCRRPTDAAHSPDSLAQAYALTYISRRGVIATDEINCQKLQKVARLSD